MALTCNNPKKLKDELYDPLGDIPILETKKFKPITPQFFCHTQAHYNHIRGISPHCSLASLEGGGGRAGISRTDNTGDIVWSPTVPYLITMATSKSGACRCCDLVDPQEDIHSSCSRHRSCWADKVSAPQVSRMCMCFQDSFR